MIGSGSSVFWDWEDGVLTWCEECDAATEGGLEIVPIRSCPDCGVELCEECANGHDCVYTRAEEEW